MRKTVSMVSALLVVLILINSVLAQGPFTAERIEVLEEEYAEEIVILEDRAGTTPDEVLYVADEVVEDVTLLLKSGEEKADYALEVKEEKIAEAALMVGENKSEEALKALSKANNVSDIVADEVGLKLGDEAWESAEISGEMLESLRGKLPTEAEWEQVSSLVEGQVSQEEKIKLASGLARKIGDYCDELAKLDYNLMEADKHCDPEQAPEWLQEYIEEEIEERQKEAEGMMLEMLTTCINDPRECDCSQIPVKSEQQKCEKNTRLAIKCEFEGERSACEQLDAEPMVPEGIPDFLRPVFEEKITELMEKKEKEMFAKFAPPECIEAGLETKEDCEELMITKYMPPECKEAGATSKEECEAIMMEKYGPPPEECMREGRPMDREECEAIMIEKMDIPDECLKDGHPIGEEECMALMMPPECKEAGATSKEECEQVMIEKMGGAEGMGPPQECMAEGKFIGEEECAETMREKMEGLGPGMGMPGMGPGMPGMPGMGPPPECFEDGEYIGDEECKETGWGGPPGEGEFPGEEKSLVEEKWEGYEVMPVREDLVIIKNPETGESETVTKEEAKKWVEEKIGKYVEEEIVPGKEMEFLKEEIEEMKEWKDKGIPPGLEERERILGEMPPGLEKEREWEEPPGWEEGEKKGWEKEKPGEPFEEGAGEEEKTEIEMPEEEETKIEIPKETEIPEEEIEVEEAEESEPESEEG